MGIVAALDVGSSKIRLMAGEIGVNNNFLLAGYAERDYAGFLDGEFLKVDELEESITHVVGSVQKKAKFKITKLFVGVPADFCINVKATFEQRFRTKTTITKKHIDALFSKEIEGYPSHTVLSISSLYFSLDNNAEKHDSLLGKSASAIKVVASVILAENSFVSLLEQLLNNLKIKEHAFLNSSLCLGVHLLTKKEKQAGATILDVGYINTAIFNFQNDGIVDVSSLSLGGAYVTSDLSEILKLPFSEAEKLKRMLVLTLRPTAIDFYELEINKKIVKIDAKTANDIALARIDLFTDVVQNCLNNFSKMDAKQDTIYLTGGGLAFMKGIKYYLSKIMKKNVKIKSSPLLQFESPAMSSVVSLLFVALKFENN